MAFEITVVSFSIKAFAKKSRTLLLNVQSKVVRMRVVDRSGGSGPEGRSIDISQRI